jgi:hypothetical protein
MSNLTAADIVQGAVDLIIDRAAVGLEDRVYPWRLAPFQGGQTLPACTLHCQDGQEQPVGQSGAAYTATSTLTIGVAVAAIDDDGWIADAVLYTGRIKRALLAAKAWRQQFRRVSCDTSCGAKADDLVHAWGVVTLTLEHQRVYEPLDDGEAETLERVRYADAEDQGGATEGETLTAETIE